MIRDGLSNRGKLAGLAASISALLVTDPAGAFCRTTTCDEKIENCAFDADGCPISGEPLYWPDECVTFGVHRQGSPRHGISFEEANRITSRAFQSWISADCGRGNHPFIGVVPFGEVDCTDVEFNNDPPGPNVNLIIFRDDLWEYDDAGSTIALATITFNVDSGEILDADVEINSAGMNLSTSDSDISSDLQSILTHEAGHFLGLAHSRDRTASMSASYDRGDLSFRTLSSDDQSAICTVYPPGEGPSECRGAQPRHGFSRFCGEDYELPSGVCHISRTAPALAATSGTVPMTWSLLLGLALIFRRRR